MSNPTPQAPQADVTELAAGHDTFVGAEEIGADAATDAPATTPLCIGIIVGATLGAGC